jgi:hypothetical protein
MSELAKAIELLRKEMNQLHGKIDVVVKGGASHV